FVLAALAIALTAGFGYGAILVGAPALGVTPGTWYSALVQAHGHAQLFGWVGLFVLGMGLFFLPRLRGTRLQHTERLPFALALLVLGIALRVIVQPLSGWLGSEGGAWLCVLLLFSAVLEMAGILVVVSILIATER